MCYAPNRWAKLLILWLIHKRRRLFPPWRYPTLPQVVRGKFLPRSDYATRSEVDLPRKHEKPPSSGGTFHLMESFFSASGRSSFHPWKASAPPVIKEHRTRTNLYTPAAKTRKTFGSFVRSERRSRTTIREGGLSSEELFCAFRTGSYGRRGLRSGFLLGFTLTRHSLFVAHRMRWALCWLGLGSLLRRNRRSHGSRLRCWSRRRSRCFYWTSRLIRRSLLGTRATLLGTLTALFAGLTFGRLLTLGALGARLTLDRGFRRRGRRSY